jgi:hypothetical protein
MFEHLEKLFNGCSPASLLKDPVVNTPLCPKIDAGPFTGMVRNYVPEKTTSFRKAPHFGLLLSKEAIHNRRFAKLPLSNHKKLERFRGATIVKRVNGGFELLGQPYVRVAILAVSDAVAQPSWNGGPAWSEKRTF